MPLVWPFSQDISGGKRADEVFQLVYTKRMAEKPKCPNNNQEFKRNTRFTTNLKGFLKKYTGKNGNLKESTKNKERNIKERQKEASSLHQ